MRSKILFLALLLGILLFGCASQQNKPVKIGYLPINVDLPLFVALDNKYFQAEGLQVEAVKFASSNLMADALVRGEIDAAASVASPVVFIAESKEKNSIKIFGYNANGNKGNFLSEVLVRKDSDITKIEDLKGKRIAIFPGTLVYSFTKIVLRNHGINESEVEISQLDSQLHLQALEGKSVDALFTYEPSGTIGEAKGISKAIYIAPFETEIVNPWASGAFVLSGKTWESKKEESMKIIRAFYKAFEFVNREKQGANKHLTNYTSIEPSLADKVPVVDFWNACQIDNAKVNEMMGILVENKIVENKVDPQEMVVGKEECSNQQNPAVKEKLKVGFVPAAFYLPLTVAMKKGFFAEEGFEPEYVRFESVNDQLLALVKGDIDVSAVGSAGGFALEARSPSSIKFVYGQDLHSYSFVVSSVSNITSIKELEGKKIGTWPSPTSKLLVGLVTSKFFNSSTMEISQLDFKLLNEALAKGEVDALFSPDVYTEAGIQKGISKYLEKDPIPKYVLNPFFNGGGIVSAKLVKENPEKAKRIQKALEKSIRYINNSPEEARKTLNAYFPVEETVALNAPIDSFYTLAEANLTNVKEVEGLFYKEGLLQKEVNASQLFLKS